jgi:hypothetical protein
MIRKPDPRPPGTRLYAVTPSLGVRLWLEHGPVVCLHVGNEGGRGRALGLVAVPLRQVDGGLACALDVAAIDAADAAGRQAFLDAHVRIREEPDLLPFTQCFTPAQWDAVAGPASLALVLLLFWQRDPRTVDGQPMDGAGGQGAEDGRDTARARAAAAFGWDEVWPAVRAAIARPDANWSRGLAYLDPADRPVVCDGSPAGSGPVHGADGRPSTSPFVFAVGSCQYPAGLMDATPAALDARPVGPPGPADASMIRLGERLRRFGDPGRPSLLVLAGDQVYVDETAGLFDPRAGAVPDPAANSAIGDEWLRVPYQNWLGSVGAQSVLGLVPSRMMLDDHEIDDNWTHLAPRVAPQDDAMNQALRRAGLAAYGHWQRDRPHPHPWHCYAQRGVRFFMADTRTERAGRKARFDPLADDAPRIMGALQEEALLAWLRQPRDRPAFVVSPSMLLPRRRTSARGARGALHSDAWDGYPRSLHALLAAIWHDGRSDLVFLSGDEHLSSVTRITVADRARTRSVTLHSIHSSALYAPYPFANSVPEEFAAAEKWPFEYPPDGSGTHFVCEVEVLRWVPGDGFAVLTLAEAAPGRWELHVGFDRASGQGPPVALTLALSSRPRDPPAA